MVRVTPRGHLNDAPVAGAVNPLPAVPGAGGRNLPHHCADILGIDLDVRELAQEQPLLYSLG